MKIERVWSKPRMGLLVTLFVFTLLAILFVATSYNVEIIRNEFSRDVPVFKIVLGAILFLAILATFILFFSRLMREIRISALQAQFLDRISHELRTPLSTLTLVTDLIRTGNVTEQEREQLWASHAKELDRIKQDVEMLLQAGKLRDARLKPEFERLSIDEWLTQEWSALKSLLGDSGVLIREGVALDQPINIDPKLMNLIFRNLFDNARKFSIDKPHVVIRTERLRPRFGLGPDRFWCDVIDQGRGFDPAKSGQLFKRFSRIESGRPVPGTGLGLYLAAVATKAMGMTLRGESLGIGQGARFRIEGELRH